MKKPSALWRGEPYPQGATWDGEGVNFALFSEHATGVELCLFDQGGRRELERIALRERTHLVWHGYLPEARPGQLYGFRVHGPYEPERGHRFNANKLLLDPYAKALVGRLAWSDAHFGYRIGHPRADLSFDRRNNAPGMPKCQVVDGAFTWGDDRHPRVPWHESVIYEAHVAGFTMRHPEVPERMRGTYAALGTAPVVEHLKRLGVTAIELLPVHAFVHDRHLVDKGLRNYWGYNSIGFFAPHPEYAFDLPGREFKTMVKTLHSAGIEVILDVVYNHTAEGSELGPSFSFRGIDNASYYRLMPEEQRYYMDYTGCGNTFNMLHPHVLRLIMDSLRYWITEMHVDGFRFDLASALARELHEVNRLGAFFDIIHQDPVISTAKLIAEPWDLGEGGYQVGKFPPGWTEWNGQYRDVVRDYWKGEGGVIGDVATRLSGSSDLYGHSGRAPTASINFVTAHDGFTLRDLVSYDSKHNEANLDENRDGENHNRSWNCGVEGPTDNPVVLALRARQQRNFIASLFLSQGVPMLQAGDELGRTQLGNNNAYCQDNELSWIDWDLETRDDDLFGFVRELIALRRDHRVFRRRHFFRGIVAADDPRRDVVWIDPGGEEMTDEQWQQDHARSFAVLLIGRSIEDHDRYGNPVYDNDFLMLLNAHHESVSFRIPGAEADRWQRRVDTADPKLGRPLDVVMSGHEFAVEGRALVVFERAPAVP